MLHRPRPLCAGLFTFLVVTAGFAPPSDAQSPGAGVEAGAMASAAQNDGFTVPGVTVDISAANANAARDKAIAQAQRTAWNTLYQRLVPGGGRAPQVSDSDLLRLVQGFEIDDEKVSATRYLGSITVHFRPQAVRDRLGNVGAEANPGNAGGILGNTGNILGTPGAGILGNAGAATAYVEPPKQPLVVLPITMIDGRPVLWEDRTPWRDAWEARTPGGKSLVPLTVPEGEMADLQAIGVEDAVNGAPAPVAAIAQRYKASGVLVVKTELPGAGKSTQTTMQVEVIRHNLDGTHETFTVPVKVDASDRPEDTLTRAVTFVSAALDESWRRTNSVPTGAEQTLVVAAPINALEDWIEMRKRLATVRAVSRVDVLSLSRAQTLVALTFRGDTERLRQTLAQHGLDLGMTADASSTATGGPAMELRALPQGNGAAMDMAPTQAINPGADPTTAPRILGVMPARPAAPARY